MARTVGAKTKSTKKQRIAKKKLEKKTRLKFCKEYRENPYKAQDNDFDAIEEKFLKDAPIRALIKLSTPPPTLGMKYKKKRKISH